MISTQALIIVLSRAGVFEIAHEDDDEIIFYDAKGNTYRYDKIGDAVATSDGVPLT